VNNKVWRLLFTALLTSITSLLALQGAEIFLGYLKGQRFDVGLPRVPRGLSHIWPNHWI
jgi:hypothetical protein